MRKVIEDRRFYVILVRIQPEGTAQSRVNDHQHGAQYAGQKQKAGNFHKQGAVPHLNQHPAHQQRQKQDKKAGYEPAQKEYREVSLCIKILEFCRGKKLRIFSCDRKGKGIRVREGNLLISGEIFLQFFSFQRNYHNSVFPHSQAVYCQFPSTVSLIHRIDPL